MKKRLYTLISCLASLLLFAACEKSDLPYYTGGNVLHFDYPQATAGLTFLNNLEADCDTLKIPVEMTGMPADVSREFKMVIPEDDTITTAPEGSWRIVKSHVDAGAAKGDLWLELKNPEKMGKKTFVLRLKITDNENFKAGGRLNYLATTITWSSDVVRPQTWSAMRWFFTSQYSSNVYRALIASTGLLEFWYYDPDPETGYQLGQYEGWVYGRKFGDWIRNYNATHDDVYRHDDGDYAGQEIVPIL